MKNADTELFMRFHKNQQVFNSGLSTFRFQICHVLSHFFFSYLLNFIRVGRICNEISHSTTHRGGIAMYTLCLPFMNHQA